MSNTVQRDPVNEPRVNIVNGPYVAPQHAPVTINYKNTQSVVTHLEWRLTNAERNILVVKKWRVNLISTLLSVYDNVNFTFTTLALSRSPRNQRNLAKERASRGKLG